MKRLANLFEVAAFLCLSSVAAGFLGRYHYLLDLAGHFRIQATFALLVSGLALRWLRRPKSSSVALFAGIILAALLWPYFSFGENSGNSDHRLFLMNVLTRNPRKADVVSHIKESDPDFVILLETDSKWIAHLDSELSKEWAHFKHLARSDNFGIAYYSKMPFATCDIVNYSASMPTPSIRAVVETDKGPLRIIATHPLPPMNSLCFTSRNELFAELAKDVTRHGAAATLVAGDFNCTPWSPWFKTLCANSTLNNSMVGNGFSISWTPFGFRMLGIPIDHVLTGSKITVNRRRVGEHVGSDHRPITVDFSIQ